MYHPRDDMYNPDNFKPTKPKKQDWNLALETYRPAIDWIKKHIMIHFGLVVSDVVHEPDISAWRFYDGSDVVLSIEHELMDRVLIIVMKIDEIGRHGYEK